MGKKHGIFKFDVGYKVSSYGRNLEIIDRKYVRKQKYKNGVQFVANDKYYKYKCLNCGNEDWIIEYSIDNNQHCGCNACCTPPKKVVKGVNDISTTAKWATPLFKNFNDIYNHHKYSKEKVEFTCPYCGKEYTKPICNVVANKGLSCICGDGISYPNKYMYFLLEQLGIDFETEKRFGWSKNRIYDFYIKSLNIIIEMHGIQHFKKPIVKSKKHKTLEEEKTNDRNKENLAKTNGINLYYQIDCSKSDSDYIKNSIIKSGLLNSLSVSSNEIDWDLCDKLAVSNLVKTICLYKNNNSHITLHEIAKIYKLSYKTILKYIKIGNRHGWCDYELNSDRVIVENSKRIDRGQKPVYCLSKDMYYRDSGVAAKNLSTSNNIFYSRQIRKSISRNSTYKGLKFIFISRKNFNDIKLYSPSKVVGDFFI